MTWIIVGGKVQSIGGEDVIPITHPRTPNYLKIEDVCRPYEETVRSRDKKLCDNKVDYYGNVGNEGLIYFQFINILPFDIVVEKGERIGQGIFKKYLLADDDNASGERKGGHGSTD